MRPILVLAWNKKICTAVKVCTAIKIVLVLVWGSYYVPDTYAPGTSEREAHPGHNNRTAVRDNCGQRMRACTCCLIDRVTAASKTEGVPAVSSIESLMIR